MAIAPAAKRPFADPKQLCRLHLAQLRPLRSTENIGRAHPSYPLVNACPIHPNPPSQEVQMTGHFTTYKTRPNHELATCGRRKLDERQGEMKSVQPSVVAVQRH